MSAPRQARPGHAAAVAPPAGGAQGPAADGMGRDAALRGPGASDRAPLDGLAPGPEALKGHEGHEGHEGGAGDAGAGGRKGASPAPDRAPSGAERATGADGAAPPAARRGLRLAAAPGGAGAPPLGRALRLGGLSGAGGPRVAAPTRVRGLILWAALAAIAFFGVLGGWAMTATLDSAAVAPGVIQADGARRPVEHLEGGIVREVLVREGARVRKGDLLVRLDETRPLAQRNILRAQLAGALATLARLDAEDRDAAEVAPGAELVALMAADPALRALFAAEARAYAANRAARAGQLAILDQRIAQLREEIGGLELGLRSARTQLALVREELSDARALLAKGLMSRPRVLALRRAEAETEGRIGQISGAIARARQSIGETQERKLQIGRDRLETAARERQGALDRVNDLRQRLIAVEDALGRLEVRAPWSGTVVDPGVNAPGAVIEPGQRLLDILPDGAELVVEARLRPSDIDVAAPGQPVRVRLTAYSFRRTPPLPGTVTRISADSILDPAGGPPYYAVQIRLDPKALPAGGEVRALPGMQVEALIGTGSQTVAQYLTAPILGAMSTALLEK